MRSTRKRAAVVLVSAALAVAGLVLAIALADDDYDDSPTMPRVVSDPDECVDGPATLCVETFVTLSDAPG